MDRKHRFNGGLLVERQAGSMVDPKTKEPITWTKALVLLVDGKKIPIETGAPIKKILELQDDPEFIDFIESLP